MIYALQPTAGDPIKLGTTENLPVRIAQLEAHYRQPLALLAMLPGVPAAGFRQGMLGRA